MIKRVNEVKRNIVGFALIELIVIMAILGILSAVAVPRFGRFIANAQNRTNQVNAKILTKTANVISATRGYYPTEAEWQTPFTSMTPETAHNLISNTITFLGDGSFKYNPSTGIVSIDGTVLEEPEESKEPEEPEEPTDEEILQEVLADIKSLNVSNSTNDNPVINLPLTVDGVIFKFTGSTVSGSNTSISISENGDYAIVKRHPAQNRTGTITMQGTLNGKVLIVVFNVVIPNQNFGSNSVTVVKL